MASSSFSSSRKSIEQTKRSKLLEQQHKAILEEDPSAFDYDGVYDQIKEQQRKTENFRSMQRLEESKKPKYIEALMKKAQERKREQDIFYDRKLQKERQKETEDFGGKDKFITSAYKKKLIEDKKWQEEEAKRLAKEEDVTKKKDLSSFYSHLLRDNVAISTSSLSSTLEDQTRNPIQSKSNSTVLSPSLSLQKLSQQQASPPPSLSPKATPTEVKEHHNTKLEMTTNEVAVVSTNETPITTMTTSSVSESSDIRNDKIDNVSSTKLSKLHDEQTIADARARYLERKASKSSTSKK